MSSILQVIVQLWNAVLAMVVGGTVGSTTATGLTTAITGDNLLILGIVAVPMVGIAVGMLKRLFSQRV